MNSIVDICSICHDPLENNTRTLPCDPRHKFHVLCLHELEKFSHNCPLCRVEAPADILNSAIPRKVTRIFSIPRPLSPLAEEVRYDDDEQFAQIPQAHPRPPLTLECIPATTQKSKTDQFDGVLKLRAPASEHTTSCDFIILADTSGSMDGEKLEQLKATLHWLNDHLSDQNRMSIVTFDDNPKRITPLKVMTPATKEANRVKIDAILADGGTSISKALDVAGRILSGRTYKNSSAYVMLITDGQDESALQESAASIVCIAQRAQLACIGLGQDHDARLLSILGERANGPFAYCENADNIPETFGGFVGAATKACALAVKLLLTCNGSQKEHTFPMITEEQEHYTLFTAKRSDIPFLEAKVTYKQPGSDTLHETTLTCKVEDLPKELSPEQNLLVDSHKNRELATKALKDATAHAEQNNFPAARTLLQDAIKTIEKSPSCKLPMCQKLIEDCKQALKKLDNPDDFQEGGSQFVYSSSAMHGSQAPIAGTPHATPSVRKTSQLARNSVHKPH